MKLNGKPFRLFSRFNNASKGILSATVLGLAMMAIPASANLSVASAEDTATANNTQQAGSYEYIGDRTIRLSGAIDQDMAEKIIDKLYELSEEDPDADIELRINSGGGNVPAGLAIYDVMKSLPNDIRTVCEGNAQSMAATLLSAGTQGKRYSFPNCRIMFHQNSWGKSGQVTDMEIITAEANRSKDRIISIIAEDTGWSEDVVRDLLERNFYPTAEEAQEMGFIDHIIEEQNPDAAPAPKSRLPDGFCDEPGRRHMRVCNP